MEFMMLPQASFVNIILLMRSEAFSTKKAHYFEKNAKKVTLTNYFIYRFLCIHSMVYEIPLSL